MSEYFNRLIEMTKLNLDFFFDYWSIHVGAIVFILIIEFIILAKRENKKGNI